jgi:hypothetical protein
MPYLDVSFNIMNFETQYNGLQPVDPNTKLWRYMDFASFYSVLINKAFFFKRLDKYTDAFEGTLNESTKRELYEYRKEFDFTTEPEAQDWTKKELERIELFKTYILSCSWTIKDDEDYSMWKIYLNGTKEGVAIQTTLNDLSNSYTGQSKVYGGKVTYEPIRKNDLNIFSVSTNKRVYYKYENEYRLILPNQIKIEEGIRIPQHEIGFNVDFDMNALIKKIYISPFCGTWFKRVIESTVDNLLPKFPKNQIVHSEIVDK